MSLYFRYSVKELCFRSSAKEVAVRCGASSATYCGRYIQKRIEGSGGARFRQPLSCVYTVPLTLAGPAMRWVQALSDGRVFCTQGIWENGKNCRSFSILVRRIVLEQPR